MFCLKCNFKQGYPRFKQELVKVSIVRQIQVINILYRYAAINDEHGKKVKRMDSKN